MIDQSGSLCSILTILSEYLLRMLALPQVWRLRGLILSKFILPGYFAIGQKCVPLACSHWSLTISIFRRDDISNRDKGIGCALAEGIIRFLDEWLIHSLGVPYGGGEELGGASGRRLLSCDL